MKNYYPIRKVFAVIVLLVLTLYGNLSSGQVLLHSEHFGTGSTFPTGWTPSSTDWENVNVNVSAGYTGASGGSNAWFQNNNTTARTLTYNNSLSTVGHGNITVLWGARLTNVEPITVHLSWSADGSVWNTVSFTNVPNNTTWALVNGGTRIALPSGASGIPDLRLRITATASVAGNNTSYRVDDFTVEGCLEPSAVISYSGSPFCKSLATGQSVTHTGTTGGTYSSTTGLTIGSGTGSITPGTSTAGTYIVTYTMAGAGSCPDQVATASVTITAVPSVTISYSGTPFCTSIGTAQPVTHTGTTGGTYTSTTGLTINAATGAITPGTSSTGTYTVTYTIAASGGCSLHEATTSVSIDAPGTWSGATGTTWNTSANWLCGVIPTTTTNVTIPGSLIHYPVLSTGTGSVENIIIQSGATLTVTGAILQIAGSIANSGTFTVTSGTIELNGSSTQTIPASAFEGNKIKNLVISNNVILAGHDSLTGILSFGNVNGRTFTTGGFLTLKSSATNTASLADITNNSVNSGNAVSGNVTVERHISSVNNRAYRLLAPAVNTATTIHANWQEGATGNTHNPNPGYGTHITGATVDQTFGFDATSTAQGSLFTYNQSTFLWVGAANTNSTALSAQTGYLLYIRGDRSIDLHSVSAPLPTTNTILRATGTLVTGTQTFSGLAGNSKFSLITNPFASSINWTTLHAGSTGVTSAYTFWDPNYGTRGGFVTVNTSGVASSGSATQHIQSGQAFFVQASGVPGPVATIRETDKSSVNNIDLFGPTPALQTFSASLFFTRPDGTTAIADGAIVIYDNNYAGSIDGDDAEEINNWDENIAIARNGKHLGIESRPVITRDDTLALFMNNMKVKDYSFIFAPSNLHALSAQLIDNFTGTRTSVSLTDSTTIPFSVSAVAGSNASDRFYIVFKPLKVLPLAAISLNAHKRNNGIVIEWIIQSENNMDSYDIEKSLNGQLFTKIASVSANPVTNNISNYQWFDLSPYADVNYYRIRTVDKNGRMSFSRIVKVNMREGKETIAISPNPVTGNTIFLQVKDLPKGNYTVSLSNKSGQQIFSKALDFLGGSATEQLDINTNYAAGSYQLRLQGEGILLTQQLLKK